MSLWLFTALLLNIVVICCEIYTLKNIKNKIDILKYYTYLQNFLALIVSMIFCIFIIINIFFNIVIPEFISGLRYIATSGLTATTLIYVVFLSRNNNLLSEKISETALTLKQQILFFIISAHSYLC